MDKVNNTCGWRVRKQESPGRVANDPRKGELNARWSETKKFQEVEARTMRSTEGGDELTINQATSSVAPNAF